MFQKTHIKRILIRVYKKPGDDFKRFCITYFGLTANQIFIVVDPSQTFGVKDIDEYLMETCKNTSRSKD